MAKKCLIHKQRQPAKFQTRRYNRCEICGRARGYLRRFDLCRICFRQLAREGKIPGITKASW